ncbi:hypothetical protein [Candidatus Liberibacter americanus]|uniref:Uncharacterized protein n=1 Tax=Candidatus Liberibacter americanus str. Sao Paulo TaxID=1261131 RepID=U6B854_9HYPH|nr:hypothetical protein [Candidatus Liberibacter americanus]AHA28046.1 hypothetical protein lam_700 [Candidatus Liberibacter americanus str. Sao Paulo]EMS35821.1 hypothetical protein G653_04731 [Candidatus Liberibacter americanus PW_SP]
MIQNFEQNKSVSYCLLSSDADFIIPWGVKDPLFIHAEITADEGVMHELAPEADFEVDTEDGVLKLISNNYASSNSVLTIFEGKRQKLKVYDRDDKKSPHSLVRESDLDPIHSRLDIVDALHVKTEDIAQKIETVESGIKDKLQEKGEKLQSLATKTDKIEQKIEAKEEKIQSLTAKTDETAQQVQSLSAYTEGFCKKVDQIDLSKIEGLDPKTREYLKGIQSQLNRHNLSLRYDDSCNINPAIDFNNGAGKLAAQIYMDLDSKFQALAIGAVGDDKVYRAYIKLYKDKDVYINGQKFIGGSDPSIFDEITRRLMPTFLGLLNGRTGVKCAVLKPGLEYKLWSTISGDFIDYWETPSENSSGYLSTAASLSLSISDEDKAKTWRIIGRTRSNYFDRWYWLQEVIDPESTVAIKTVSTSTLKDNFVDLQTMQSRMNNLVDTTTLDTRLQTLDNKLQAVEKSISATVSGNIITLKQELEAMEKKFKELEPLKEYFSPTGNLVLKQKAEAHTPSITFKDMQGKDTHYVFSRGDKLNIVVAGQDGDLGNRISISPRDIKFNDHTIDEIIKESLKHRTGVFGAELKGGKTYRLWDLVSGSEIVAWKYPCEDSSGYKHGGSNALMPSAENKAKTWRVFGISEWDHHGNKTYWLQEEITNG